MDETVSVRRMEGIRNERIWTATNSAGRGASARAFARVGSGVTPAVYCFSLGNSTDPLSRDSDGDGLNNFQEFVSCTNPIDKDTDVDGYLDFWELLCPTNVADAWQDWDGDGLINLHEFWTKCNPSVYDGTNYVLSAFADGGNWRRLVLHQSGRRSYNRGV